MIAASPIRRLLVANRGEIAVRVIRSARRLDIATVAVYAAPDRGALHTLLADAAVPLPGQDPRSAYLDFPALVDIARAEGCDAVHPGYGFLSENPDLVEACDAAGLVFVGPRAETLRAMGLKIASRKLMEAAGVPVIPGVHEASSDEDLREKAEALGFPLLVKASAGGGGKGMRRVDRIEDLPAALAGARREAAGAFGDATVYVERFFEPARHVEVQVVGDARGEVVHVGERDCSVQRRYQKVVEQAPAPDLPEEVRAGLHEAALRAARAVGYRGAGTVEFVVGSEGSFYFLEMNTRLQVEHGVSELVYGVDLVAAQLRIAGGEPLPWAQEELRPRGAAVECRLYAEDPARGFLPAPGPLLRFIPPEGPGVRVDAGVRSGDRITADFDPLIAKILTWGADREAALGRMRVALSETVVLGMRTNLELLQDLLGHPDFGAGAVDTAWLPRTFEGWGREAGPEDLHFALAALATAQGYGAEEAGGGDVAGGDRHSPWGPGRVAALFSEGEA